MEQSNDTFDVFAMFATDPDKEVNGAWVKQPGNCELLVARQGNRAYSRLIAKKYEEYREVLESDTPEAEVKDEQIIVEVMAETILLGWKNLVYKGQVLPYSKENARKVLSHRDFRLHVGRLAGAQANYKAELEEAQKEA